MSLTVANIRDNSSVLRNTDTEKRNMLMVLSTKDTGDWTSAMGKANFKTATIASTRAVGRLICATVTAK